jgi:PhnB protein
MSDTTTIDRPDAAVMRGVIPYLSLAGRAGEAADFYMRAFGAEDIGRMPDTDRPGQYMHVQVAINGGALMMTDQRQAGTEADPPLARGHLQLVVEDGRLWWDRALAAGCTIVMPYERQFWGDDWGLLADPFGIHWAILQPGPDHA